MRVSCGLLMYVRDDDGALSVLLGHPGGPFWRGKDAGAWSVPKGLPQPDETLLDAARREFEEETGLHATAPFVELTPLKQKSGKIIHCWAFEGAYAPPGRGVSEVEIEWPPASGRRIRFPEIDEARLFDIETALTKIAPLQAPFLAELVQRLA